MSLHPQTIPPIPTQTAAVAQGAFRKGHPYLRLRDQLGTLFDDTLFQTLFATRGRPAEAPWRLALVTLLQFAEGLSDRQAADAVRARLDWKYLLSLELDDPGFDHSILCTFRARLVEHQQERLLFDHLLTRFREAQLLVAGGVQRTDATHVLAAVRTLNRLELVGETLRHALQTLAELAPAWLREHAAPEWVERYDRPCSEWRLPKGQAAREALARTIGQDGYTLLRAVAVEAATGGRWHWLREVPALETLRQIWVQQFRAEEVPPGPQSPQGAPVWRCVWRAKEDLPPAAQAWCSPYDPDARFAKKRETTWVGYKVHVTETCEPTQPRLITDVHTTAAPAGDPEALAPIQARLAERDLKPHRQVVDSGYVSAGEVVRSARDHAIELYGPPQGDRGWQAQEGTGYSLADFIIDWQAEQVQCPAGQTSQSWQEHPGRSGPVIQVRFARETCAACPSRAACTRAATSGRRLTLPREAEYQALLHLRADLASGAGRVAYAVRAGIEGTLSQAVHRSGLRRSRYLGQVKVHLQHLFTAAALNLLRVAEWLEDPSRSRVRSGAFARLMAST